ncbi:MAG: guanosine-3',5'-bis(diphosphate) 3'-pyrophosphohydrolase, partial [Snodgrassella sp.]|nr:guanosine-3',5'-bis(diphosphate) 3'-pyrophosphohydrolase [Snodgrassella sp.]
MFPPSLPYKPPVNQWRDSLFAQTEYLNKQERWQLLEQACAYIYTLAEHAGKTALLKRSFDITTSLAQHQQRIQALAAVLIKIAFEDLSITATDKHMPSQAMGPVGMKIFDSINTSSHTSIATQLKCCQQQIESSYQAIIAEAQKKLLHVASYLSK